MCISKGSGPSVVLFPLSVVSTAGLCLERSVTETHLGWEDIIDFFQFPPLTFYEYFKHLEKLIELWIPICPSPKFYNCYYFAIFTLSLFTYLCVYLLGVWFDGKEIFHKFRWLKRKSFSLKKAWIRKGILMKF